MEYTKDNPLRVFTAFSGYDSQCLALKRLGIPFDLIGWSEIDKYAIQAHDVLFPEYKDRNYGDISKIDWFLVPDFDLFTYSFPCTNISNAGKQEGFDEWSSTASSLLWECRKAIVAKKPKYLLMENVKALLSAKFKPLFMKWQNELASYGYSNFMKVLDAQDYGVPQHRERVFMVSILDENASFHFPEPFPLDKRLKDVLEEYVDEKYYLSKKIIDTFIERNKINEDKGNGFKFEPTDGDCVASSVLTMPGSRPCDNYIKEPIACAMRGRNPDNPSDRTAGIPTEQRVEVGGDVANCITTVQKDRFVVVPKIIQVANISEEKSFSNPQTGRIYSSEGLCPTLDTMHGGGRQPKIVEPSFGNSRLNEMIRDNAIPSDEVVCVDTYNKSITRDIFCTIKSNIDKENLKYVAEPLSCAIRGRNLGNGGSKWEQSLEIGDEAANAITSVHKDSMVVEPPNGAKSKRLIKVLGNGKIRGFMDTKDKRGCSDFQIDNEESIASTVVSAHIPKCYGESMGFRIRKLTVREVFRLMDVDDEDVDKLLASGISNTRLYCMAGNSIVISCLYHIFRKLFVEKENENKQLKLF